MNPKSTLAAALVLTLCSGAATAQLGSGVVVDQPMIITGEIADNLIITGGTVANPVELAFTRVTGSVEIREGAFAVRRPTAPEAVVDGDFIVRGEGTTFVNQRPSANRMTIRNNFQVIEDGAVNLLPSGQNPFSEFVVVEGNLELYSGGGGFFNRISVNGNAEAEGAFSMFLADSSQIGGNLEAKEVAVVSMETTICLGNVEFTDCHFEFSPFPVPVVGTTTVGFGNVGFFSFNIILGNLEIKDNTGGFGAPLDLALGNPEANTPACVPVGLAVESTTVLGDAEILNNHMTASIIISGLQVSGDLVIDGNSAGLDLMIGVTGFPFDALCDGNVDLFLLGPTAAPSTVLEEFVITNNSAGRFFFFGDQGSAFTANNTPAPILF